MFFWWNKLIIWDLFIYFIKDWRKSVWSQYIAVILMWVLLLNILSCYKNKQSHKTNTFCNQVRMFFLKNFRGQRNPVQYFLLRVFLRLRNSVDMVLDLDIPTISSYTCLCVEIPWFFKWQRGIKALLPSSSYQPS